MVEKTKAAEVKQSTEPTKILSASFSPVEQSERTYKEVRDDQT